MNDDADLLRQYVRSREEAAFRTVVERRIGFVYAVALRRLGNREEAEDVTQAVFIALVRKAAKFAEGTSVAGWLHRACCFECRNLLRARSNRLARETEVERQREPDPAASEQVEAGELGAVLDETLNDLPLPDREAILAHFFLGQTFAQIGASSGRSENAARMRVTRALERLRMQLERRGFASAAPLLAIALPTLASARVPPGLSPKIASAAVASAGSASTLAILSMSTTKIVATLATLAALTLIGIGTHHSYALQEQVDSMRKSEAESGKAIADLRKQLAALKNLPRGSAASSAFPIQPTERGAAQTTAQVRAGVTVGAPPGWHKNGSNPDRYDIGVDTHETWGGMPSAYIGSHDDAGKDGFGGFMQTTAADSYRGQRVQVTGWVKTADANDGGGHLWFRIDGDGSGNAKMLGFDNMQGRSPVGTTDWQEYSMVLEVPSTAQSLNFGAFVQGRGEMWVSGLTIHPVGADIPTTDMTAAKPQLPPQPVNLGFTPATK